MSLLHLPPFPATHRPWHVMRTPATMYGWFKPGSTTLVESFWLKWAAERYAKRLNQFAYMAADGAPGFQYVVEKR